MSHSGARVVAYVAECAAWFICEWGGNGTGRALYLVVFGGSSKSIVDLVVYWVL